MDFDRKISKLFGLLDKITTLNFIPFLPSSCKTALVLSLQLAKFFRPFGCRACKLAHQYNAFGIFGEKSLVKCNLVLIFFKFDGAFDPVLYRVVGLPVLTSVSTCLSVIEFSL